MEVAHGAIATGLPAADLRYDGVVAPAILVCGDDALRARRLVRLVDGAGALQVAQARLAEASDRMEGRRFATILIDATRDDGHALGILLPEVVASVAVGRVAAIVVATFGALDEIVAPID